MQAHPGSKSVCVPLCPPPPHHPCSCHQSSFRPQGRADAGGSVAFPERLLSLSKRIWDLSKLFTRADGLGFSLAPGTEGPHSSTCPLNTFACLRFLLVVNRALRTSACGFAGSFLLRQGRGARLPGTGPSPFVRICHTVFQGGAWLFPPSGRRRVDLQAALPPEGRAAHLVSRLGAAPPSCPRAGGRVFTCLLSS